MSHPPDESLSDDDRMRLKELVDRAIEGDPQALSIVGASLKQRSPGKAAILFRHQAEQRNVDAMMELASLYFEQGDAELAKQWWRSAAQGGDTNAIFNLGVLSAESSPSERRRPGEEHRPTSAFGVGPCGRFLTRASDPGSCCSGSCWSTLATWPQRALRWRACCSLGSGASTPPTSPPVGARPCSMLSPAPRASRRSCCVTVAPAPAGLRHVTSCYRQPQGSLSAPA
jgi:TPR repeat protein